MKRIVWSQSAVADYENLLTFIAADNLPNARLVQDRIDKTIRLLTDFQFGQPGPRPGTFKHYIPNTSHFVVYRFVGDERLEIVRILHAARDWTLLDWRDER